jgi:hypothetical protein
VLNAKLVLVAAFAALLVFSAPLAITSTSASSASKSRKAPRAAVTKVKAVSTIAERVCPKFRAAERRLVTCPSHVSPVRPLHDFFVQVFRPLRC